MNHNLPDLLIAHGAVIACTGDACQGDVVGWTETVFDGSFRRPKPAGERTIVASITADSYGGWKQQHTFTLVVIAAVGHGAPPPGTKIRRKGRNLYRRGTWRAAWEDEPKRITVLED